MMETRCWCGFGTGRGVVGLRCRLCSRPRVVVVYCQARIVGGREGGGDMMRGGGVEMRVVDCE